MNKNYTNLERDRKDSKLMGIATITRWYGLMVSTLNLVPQICLENKSQAEAHNLNDVVHIIVKEGAQEVHNIKDRFPIVVVLWTSSKQLLLYQKN